jgi:hypothetical protein
LIVDITADQFEEQPRPVVVDAQSNWHATFRLQPEDQEQPADFERYDKVTTGALTAGHSFSANVRIATRLIAKLVACNSALPGTAL